MNLPLSRDLTASDIISVRPYVVLSATIKFHLVESNPICDHPRVSRVSLIVVLISFQSRDPCIDNVVHHCPCQTSLLIRPSRRANEFINT